MSSGITASSIQAPRALGVNTWWDAINPSGNNVIPTDGTSLASISDLGLNGNTVTQATGANQILFKRNIINNQNVFRFSGSQFASCASSAANNYVGPLTIVAIAAPSTTLNPSGGDTRIISKGNNGVTLDGYGMGMVTGGKSSFTTWNIKDYSTTNEQMFLGNYLVATTRYNSNFSVDFYTNGAFIQNITNGSGFTVASQPLIFGAKNTTPGSPWSGDVIAVFIFYRALTTSELNLIHAYALGRIGLNSSFVPSNNSKTLFWLDGNDPNATGVTPTNGSAVSLWKDKSINGYNFSQSTGANQPLNVNSFRNSLNAVSFNGTSHYLDSLLAIDYTNSFSLVFALQFENLNAGYPLNIAPGSTAPEAYINVNSSIAAAGVWSGSANKGQVNAAIVVSTFYIFTYTYDVTGNANLWVNGVLIGTTTTAGYSAAGAILRRLGAHAGVSAGIFFSGKIADAIVTSGVLNDAERNQMETYLHKKWNG